MAIIGKKCKNPKIVQLKIDPDLSLMMLIIISDGKERVLNMQKQPDLVGLSENMQKWENAIFSNSLNVPILKFYGVIPTTKTYQKIIKPGMVHFSS